MSCKNVILNHTTAKGTTISTVKSQALELELHLVLNDYQGQPPKGGRMFTNCLALKNKFDVRITRQSRNMRKMVYTSNIRHISNHSSYHKKKIWGKKWQR